MKVHYSVDDEDYVKELAGNWCIHRPLEQMQIAEKCASDFFFNHGGREIPWPQIITLHDSLAGEVIAKITVELESEPVFNAYVIEK